MAKKFRGPDIVNQIDDALNKGLARFLVNTQSKLSASSPVDTGRLASSWMIGKGAPDRSVPPERTEPGSVDIQEYGGEITMDSDWFISSNLPYTQRAALDPGYVGRRGAGRGDWFTAIENGLPRDANAAFEFFLKKVK